VIKVGRFQAAPLSDGVFRLDGGAMYGTVPKTLWCKHEQVDEKNRIPLALGCLLIKTPRGRNVLVDTGLSSKYDANGKFTSIYAVERKKTLRDELREQGLAPEDVHFVVNTHLHFDHAGGDTEVFDGKLKPQFPNARYLIQKDEWEDANHAHERNRASYLEENFAPLQDAGVLELVDGDFELEPGLKVSKSGGHSRGHQVVMLESEGEKAIYLGDLVPTRAHVPLPFIMGYDLYPVDTLERKRQYFKLIFQHDVGRRHAKLGLQDGRYYARLD